MTAKIKIRQYVIFIEPQKFNTADIECYTVLYTSHIRLSIMMCLSGYASEK